MISPVLLVCLSLVVGSRGIPLHPVANDTVSRALVSDSASSSLPDDSIGAKHGILCGNFATASKNDVVVMLRGFRHRFPNGSEDTCGAPGKTCTRQACRNTSGLYDNVAQADVRCSVVAEWLSDISDGCCTTSVIQSKGLSGQQFSTAGWNVAVAYADCNDDADADRPANFVAWGPNGQCLSYGE